MIFEHLDRIVFAGDSVTDMGSEQPVGEGLFDNLGQGYVRMVDNLLGSCYPERYIRVTNAGISGNTSRDLLERFDRDVLALKPDWVSIMIGINDVWRQFDSPALLDTQVQPEEYRANLVKMLTTLKAQPQLKGIILMAPYYMEPLAADPMRTRMDEYGAICRELAAEFSCTFVDLQAVFNDYFRFRHPTYIAWDRVHPNEIGAMIIARAFLDAAGFDYTHQAE